MVTTLVGFLKDITHITVLLLLSKAGRNLDKEECSGALFNDLSEALECILLNFFNVKLHATQPRSTIYTTAQKMKFTIKDFFNNCDQIRSFLRIWSCLLNKFLMENFNFCAVQHIGNAWLVHIKVYLRPCKTSMIERLLKIDNG